MNNNGVSVPFSSDLWVKQGLALRWDRTENGARKGWSLQVNNCGTEGRDTPLLLGQKVYLIDDGIENNSLEKKRPMLYNVANIFRPLKV